MYTLRPYQEEIIPAARQSIRVGKKSILIVLPTGGGKTVIFAQIAANAASMGKRVLTLVHRQEIFSQTLQKYFDFGIAAGQIAAGKTMTKNNIQVAMVQTIANRVDQVTPPDVIIIDEGHHAVASTWQRVLTAFPDSIKLFFTATPVRMDGRGMGDICDHMINGWGIVQLIADGWLVLPKIIAPPPGSYQELHLKRGDFDRKEQTKKMSGKKIIGDVIEHHRKYLSHQPTISFVSSLEHGALMEDVYRDAGIKAKLIQGGQKYMKDRKQACQQLADGSLEILISCDVISEGYDVPAVAGCHLLRRTMSTGLYIQQTGRTLRPIYSPGYDTNTRDGRLAAIKNSCKPVSHILDFVDNYDLHGHIIQEREWDLQSRKRDPRKSNVNITRCPQCGGVWPGKPQVCLDPDCGYSFVTNAKNVRKLKINNIEAQLVEAIPGISVEDISGIAAVLATGDKNEKQKAMMAQAYAAIKSGNPENERKLKELAKIAGYKPGWLNWAYKYVRGKQSS